MNPIAFLNLASGNRYFSRVTVALCVLASGCTVFHSKQADFATVEGQLSAHATFITEEDSGLSILGVFVIAEPDHFAVLMDRAQRRYNCSRLRFAQMDFYTDHWGIVGFPISRVTLVCEHNQRKEREEKEK